jgi:hypothetical protein
VALQRIMSWSLDFHFALKDTNGMVMSGRSRISVVGSENLN